MRAALRYSLTGASAGAAANVIGVQSTIFRDYWVRVASGDGITYSVDVYRSKDEADTQQARLGFGTCGAGLNVSSVIAPDGAAPFVVTPMTVFLTLGGTFTSAIFGWVAAIEAALIDRMASLLALYSTANEALSGINYAGVGLGIPAILPCYGIRPGKQGVDREHRDMFIARVGVELFVAAEGTDDPAVIHECVSWCETLRSIALDEQMTWGGWAINTTTQGIEPAMSADNDLVVYEAKLPLMIEVPGLYPDRPPGESPSSGGKYVVGL